MSTDQNYYTTDYTRGKPGFNVPMHTLIFVDEPGELLGGIATGVADPIPSTVQLGVGAGQADFRRALPQNLFRPGVSCVF